MNGGGGPEPYAEVVASRARILAAADAERAALQRELHDGAQQRVVHALIALKQARSALEPGSPGADWVDEALANVERANADLRGLVHRVLPRTLVHGGLGSGLRSLVDHVGVPVRLRVDLPRLRAEDETTAYIVVAEILTAAVVHADARRIDVTAGLERGTLVVDVCCAGRPVHDVAPRNVWTSARDRARAGGGRLTVAHPGVGDTVVRAELPVRVGGGVEPEGVTGGA